MKESVKEIYMKTQFVIPVKIPTTFLLIQREIFPKYSEILEIGYYIISPGGEIRQGLEFILVSKYPESFFVILCEQWYGWAQILYFQIPSIVIRRRHRMVIYTYPLFTIIFNTPSLSL